MKINEWPRHGIQALWAFITNSHVTGFVTGKIYTGKLKNACVPGLNCYSCPGAVGACPIGSLQAVIGSWNFKMAYYVVGFLIFIGAMVGRLICGFLCPFGLIQDLLNKIPFPKKIRTFKGDKLLLMPYGSLEGIGLGCRVEVENASPVIYPHPSWLGRIINAFGEAIDG